MSGASKDQKISDCIEAVNSIISSLTTCIEHDTKREELKDSSKDTTPLAFPPNNDAKLRNLLQKANMSLIGLSSHLLKQTDLLSKLQKECSPQMAGLINQALGDHQQTLEKSHAARVDVSSCLKEAHATCLPLRSNEKIEYLTDVEGNWDYFLKWLDYSSVLELTYKPQPQDKDKEQRNVGSEHFDTETHRLELKPDCYFVFGGDAVDKGNGDIRFVKAMTQLKRDYPDRVFLVMGNRDANKLRFSAELESNLNGNDVDPYWAPKHKPYETFLEEESLEDSTVATLKWILAHTMGANTTFEFRRDELALIHCKKRDEVTDEDVLESFQSSVDIHGKDPWMLEFLRLGCLMVVIGDVVFVHGGICTSEQLCTVPGSPTRRCNLEQWADELNAFYTAQIREFERMPKWVGSGKNKRRGGTALLDYGVPGGNQGNTVVYSGYKDKKGAPQALAPEPASYLHENGVRWLVCGHQPQGTCPTVIVGDKVNVVCCDTSYSDMKSPDSRGKVVTHASITNSHVRLRGVLEDGSEHTCMVTAPHLENDYEDSALIGRELSGHRWVKSIRSDGKLMVARPEGRSWVVEYLSLEEVKQELM